MGREIDLRRPEAAWCLAGTKIRDSFFHGRLHRALEGLQVLIASDAKPAWALALRAEVNRSAGMDRMSEALEDLERAAADSPGSFWIQGLNAKALAQAGRLVDAGTVLDRAIELEPRCPWVRLERAYHRLAQGDFWGAAEDARSASSSDPGSRRAQLALADCLFQQGRPQEAIDQYDRALRARSPKRKDVSPEGIPGPLVFSLRFQILRALGRHSEAAKSLRRAVIAGERVFWSEGRAQADQSLRELDEALRHDLRDPWLHFWKGEIYREKGDLTGADKEFTSALKVDPRFIWARAWRGWSRLLRGSYEEALKDIDGALKTKKWMKAWPHLEYQLYSLRGQALTSLRRYEQASAAFTKSLAGNGGLPADRLRRAQAWISLGDSAQAHDDLRLALDRDPGFRPAYLMRARLRKESGNLAGALNDLHRSKTSKNLGTPAALLDPGHHRTGGVRPVRKARRLGEVRIDPRIELVGLMKLIAAPEKTPAYCLSQAPEMADYISEAVERFSPFVGPGLRAAFRSTRRSRGNPDFPWLGITQMMMGVTDLPEMRITTPAWRASEDIRLLHGLKDFVKRSRFMGFLNSHQSLFDRWTAPIAAVVEKEDYAATVSDYLGVRIEAYCDVILTPLLRGVDLRAILESYDGLHGARTVFGPLGSKKHFQRYFLAPEREELLWTGWHELLHMSIDSLSAFYSPESEAFRHLYKTVPREAQRKDWVDCFSEHFVRAATQRILSQRCGPGAAETLAAEDRDAGYRFTDGLVHKLKDYESHRDRYPTLGDFFPAWLEAWKAQA